MGQLIVSYWARRVDLCRTCSTPLDIHRNFVVYPEMVTVSIAEMMTSIDKRLYFEGTQYSIFAVAYRGWSHFIALIKLQNEIYEYDGNSNLGKLRHFGIGDDCFTNVIGDTSNRLMKAVVIWYKKTLE